MQAAALTPQLRPEEEIETTPPLRPAVETEVSIAAVFLTAALTLEAVEAAHRHAI